MIKYTMPQINYALDCLSCEPCSPDWEYVQVLTHAINELAELRERMVLQENMKI